MKNIRLFSIMLGCLAVLMTASCNKTEDNTKEQQEKWEQWLKELQAEITAMHGDYEGYIYYQKTSNSQEADSVAARWSVINDSTIMLTNVPTELIARKISDSQPELKQALLDAGTIDVTVQVGYNSYMRSPIAFYLYPKAVQSTLPISGTPNKVVINFYNYNEYKNTVGQFLVSTGEILFDLYPQTVTVEGQVRASFYQDAILNYYGKKK